MTTITGPVRDVAKNPDRTKWFFTSELRQSGDDTGTVVSTTQHIVTPNFEGILTVELDPGPVTIKYGNRQLRAFVPDVPTFGLWDLISADVLIPPGTPSQVLAAAVEAWLTANPPDPADGTDVTVSRDATSVTVVSSTGADGVVPAADGTNAGVMTAAMQSKLAAIEAAADVTDAANVAAAGAVMKSDTSTALMQFVVDEDGMASDSATKVPTQQSVRAFVLAQIAALIGAAPAELDTWIELVSAIQDNEDALEGINTALSGKQPLDAALTALSALSTAANKLIYADGSDSFATTDLTAFGRTVLGYANAAALKVGLSLAKADVGLGNVDNTADNAKAVLSATKLATARQINGVGFDGTANITVADATKQPLVESVNVVAASGAAQTIPDPAAAQTMSRITLTANCTLAFPTPAAGKSCSVALAQDGTGGRTVTWPASVKWADGIAPTLTTVPNKVDRFAFLCDDGATWAGFVAGLNFV